ncbi:18882_t:CDS:2, partial [Racocetra persica]
LHHVEEDSQRARHCLAMLRWSVINFEIFMKAGWKSNPKMIRISTPRVALKLLTAVFKEQPDDELRSVATILQMLRKKVITMTLKLIPVRGPGNAGYGSARSDFAAIVNNNNDLQFAFFLVEFEQNGFEVHKDDIVVIAEAVHEFNRILSLMHYPEKEVNETVLHIGLVNDTTIRFGSLRPIYYQEKSTLFYIYEDEILSFNLHEKSMETNVERVLRLVTYLRETVCADRMRIRMLLNRHPAQFNYDLKAALPTLPGEAVQSRTFKVKFTPPSKRVKYNVYNADFEWLVIE